MDVAGLDEHRLRGRPQPLVAHRPCVLYWVLQPGSRRRRHRPGPGPHGPAVERVADRLGLRHQRPPPDGRRRVATEIVRNLVGDDTHPDVKIRSTSLWGNNKLYATATGAAGCSAWATPSTGTRRATASARTRRSRTPTTSRGSSPTCCGARPAPGLLDSYEAERAPVGRQIVLRANQSIEEFGPIFDALGLVDTTDPEGWRRTSTPRKDDTPEARARSGRATRGDRAQGLRVQRARRRAQPALRVRPRSSPTARRSRSTTATPSSTTTRRRGRARSCRTLARPRRPQVCTHDLAGKGRFTLLTGIGGEAWARPRASVAAPGHRASRRT